MVSPCVQSVRAVVRCVQSCGAYSYVRSLGGDDDSGNGLSKVYVAQGMDEIYEADHRSRAYYNRRTRGGNYI
jgi:hypothetical protein